MLFSSYIFLFVFLPVTLVGFCLLSRFAGPKPAKLWLSLASLFFYGWWNPVYVILLMASMVANFWLGRRIGAAARAGSGKTWLYLGISANLLLLGYYKYANFFVSNLNALQGIGWMLEKIVLPLGISFFTFTQIAYLMDAGQGDVCEYDFGDFLLFVTFFPHLIAGPIIHHAEMMPQFAETKTYRFDWNNLAAGLAIFSIGLFKKAVIADALSGHAGKVFDAAAGSAPLYSCDAWAGALSYTFQIYFDFSGYSDMAIGLARMFGITLPLNFDSPYRAVNIIEFWRRWHMTLSRFLRDYLYIPLGGNRLGRARRYLNLLLTMLLGGLWHGAAWTFVLWGLFHGVCLALNHLWQWLWGLLPLRRFLPGAPAIWTARFLTFLLVVIGWVLFRSADFHGIRQMLGAMSHLAAEPAAGAPALLKTKTWFSLAGLLAFVWLLPNTAQLTAGLHPYPAVLKDPAPAGALCGRWRTSPAWACLTGLLLAVALLSLSRSGEFLYYNF